MQCRVVLDEGCCLLLLLPKKQLIHKYVSCVADQNELFVLALRTSSLGFANYISCLRVAHKKS